MKIKNNSTKTIKAGLLGASAMIVAGAFATPVLAQPGTQADADDTIVVTARKREESLYETPAAVSAFAPETLAERNISNLDDVGKHVPNLNVSRYGVGNGSQAAIFIRGIGLQDHIITTDPGVGVYLDGVYLGRQMGSNLSLVNIERIEVLRGPQGTLYGRNTLGGAVNIVTRQPDSGEGAVINARGGSRGRAQVEAYGQTALTDDLAIGISSYFKRRNGVGDFLLLDNPERRIGEEKEYGGRITARWEPADNLSVLLAFDGMEAENGQSPYQIEITGGIDPSSNFVPGTATENRPNPFIGDFPALQPGFPTDLSAFGYPQLIATNPDDSLSTVAGLESTSNSTWGGSATINYDVSDNLSSKFIASYRSSEYTGGLDDDESPLHLSEFPETGEAEQISLEWQLSGQIGALDFVGGLYYFNEDGSTESGPFVFSPFNAPDSTDNFGVPIDLGFPTGLGFFDLHQETDSYAIYGSLEYQVTDRIGLGGGLRYSWDKKDANAMFPSFAERAFREADFEELTWDVNATYALGGNMNLYAQVQKGYQPGQFPPRPFSGAAAFEVSPEQTALNYEVGFKGDINDYLSVVLSGFWTKYRDLNLPFSDTGGVGFETSVPTGDSRSRGFELETVLRPFDGFTINTAVGYNDAEIVEIPVGADAGVGLGDAPALTPKWTLSIAPSYRAELANGGAIKFNADYSYRSDMFGQSINNPNELLEARDLFGFSIDYEAPDGSWTFGVYGENVFNEIYDAGRLQQTGFVGVVRSNDRSEFGARLTKRFGEF